MILLAHVLDTITHTAPALTRSLAASGASRLLRRLGGLARPRDQRAHDAGDEGDGDGGMPTYAAATTSALLSTAQTVASEGDQPSAERRPAVRSAAEGRRVRPLAQGDTLGARRADPRVAAPVGAGRLVGGDAGERPRRHQRVHEVGGAVDDERGDGDGEGDLTDGEVGAGSQPSCSRLTCVCRNEATVTHDAFAEKPAATNTLVFHGRSARSS